MARRLGMSREGVLRENYPYRGVRHDMEIWSVLAPEWRAARARAAHKRSLRNFSDDVRTVRGMGTKTADETGAETGTEAQSDEAKSGKETVDITKRRAADGGRR